MGGRRGRRGISALVGAGYIFCGKAGWRSWEGMGERIEELRQEGAELPGWLVWPLD